MRGLKFALGGLICLCFVGVPAGMAQYSNNLCCTSKPSPCAMDCQQIPIDGELKWVTVKAADLVNVKKCDWALVLQSSCDDNVLPRQLCGSGIFYATQQDCIDKNGGAQCTVGIPDCTDTGC